MNTLSNSDKISIASTLIAFFGFILLIYQVTVANKQLQKAEVTQRAQFLSELQSRSFGNKDFRQIFQQIEYNQINFDSGFHGSENRPRSSPC
jgi:hypothetical protein